MYLKKSINKILYIQNYHSSFNYITYIHKYGLNNCNSIHEENQFKLKMNNSFRP